MATLATTPRFTPITVPNLGSAGPFNVGFRIFSSSLLVFVDGLPRTDWTLTATFAAGFADGATITFSAPLPGASKLVIFGNLVPQRAVDYVNGDPKLTDKLNIELAHLWAAVAEVKNMAESSVRTFAPVRPFIPVEGAPVEFVGGQPVSGEADTGAEEAAALALAAAIRAEDAADALTGATFATEAFTTPQTFGATGDGTTDDTTDFEEFVAGGTDAVFGLIPPAVYRIGSGMATGVINSRVVGALGSVIERETGTTNTFSLQDPLNVDLEGMTLDGRWATLGTNGHGLVLIDPSDVTVDRLTTFDYGGADLTNGGAGLLVYPDGNPTVDRVRVTRSSFEGNTSDKAFGIVMDNAEFCTISDSHASAMTQWGLEFKNDSAFSILSSSTADFCTYSFGLGFEGTPDGHNNIFGLLASKNSDQGFHLGRGTHNTILGLSAHADTAPDHFLDGNVYGLHLEEAAHENIALGILTSGTAMDYPVRIRGDRNVVSIADYSSAGRSVVFHDGSQENYVEVLHFGAKAQSIVGLIEDQNAVVIKKGDGANMVDSPTTREYFGSTRDHFTWGLDGYTNAYVHYSTTGFLFEGTNGRTVIGMGVKADQEAGITVSNESTAGLGSILYVNSATPYWRYNVASTEVLRLDATKLSPAVAGAVALGSSTFPFGDAFMGSLSLTPRSGSGPVLANNQLGFEKMSNTSIRLHFRGSDGVLRYNTLTFA
jgi:hypothetical protein